LISLLNYSPQQEIIVSFRATLMNTVKKRVSLFRPSAIRPRTASPWTGQGLFFMFGSKKGALRPFGLSLQTASLVGALLRA
jgi:hypothetical protein